MSTAAQPGMSRLIPTALLLLCVGSFGLSGYLAYKLNTKQDAEQEAAFEADRLIGVIKKRADEAKAIAEAAAKDAAKRADESKATADAIAKDVAKLEAVLKEEEQRRRARESYRVLAEPPPSPPKSEGGSDKK
jgi:hypothetical protein